MGGSQKLKRVSWASDVNLCQVRLFLSEESPSQVGLVTQDHLQAKAWPLQAGGMGFDENLPPGFEGIQPANPWAAKLSLISLLKWKCPPKLGVDSSWRVVAGEESREIETQNQREMRVLEAVYPRPSAIPLNPCALVGVEDSTNNDHCTPVVPITPIEDEDASLDTTSASMVTQQQHSPHPHGTFSSHVNNTLKPAIIGMEPDIITAAQAALSSVMSSSEQGNLIDRELLTKILGDPKMIEQLIANHAATSTGQNIPSSSMPSSSTFHGMHVIGSENAVGTKNVASSSSPGVPSTSAQYIPPKSYRREMVRPPTYAASGSFHPPSRPGSVQPYVPDSPLVTKDINYYKSLIQQHGGERRETVPQFGHQNDQEPLNNMMMKPKIMKPCIYFNSSRGCRNGASCAFQHDATSPQKLNNNSNNTLPEVQGSKRVKLDREISGA